MLVPILLNTQRIRSRFAGVECVAGWAGRIRFAPTPVQNALWSVDQSTSRLQNDFNVHDFPLHAVASCCPSAQRGVARSLCTTWHRMVYPHAVASRGLSARRDVARSLRTP